MKLGLRKYSQADVGRREATKAREKEQSQNSENDHKSSNSRRPIKRTFITAGKVARNVKYQGQRK